MRLTSLIVWCLLILGTAKLTVYGYGQAMKQFTALQNQYVSIGSQVDDPDITQATTAIGAIGH